MTASRKNICSLHSSHSLCFSLFLPPEQWPGITYIFLLLYYLIETSAQIFFRLKWHCPHPFAASFLFRWREEHKTRTSSGTWEEWRERLTVIGREKIKRIINQLNDIAENIQRQQRTNIFIIKLIKFFSFLLIFYRKIIDKQIATKGIWWSRKKATTRSLSAVSSCHKHKGEINMNAFSVFPIRHHQCGTRSHRLRCACIAIG